MVRCPRCDAAFEHGICGCGYNPIEEAALFRELTMWKNRRRLALGGLATAFGILMFVPLVSIPLAAALGGLLVSAATVFSIVTHHHFATARRALRALQTRAALPEARLR